MGRMQQSPLKRRFLVEINTTPFVDVMLVLLVIFMITVPLMNQGLDVDLPFTRTVESLPKGADHFIMSLTADGKVFLDQRELDPDRIADHVRQLVIGQGRYLYLKADKHVSHGRVMEILSAIKEAGVNRVGIVTEKQEE